LIEDVSEKPLYTSEEVVSMNEKKQFVEPEVLKCEEALDKVTLSYNSYGGDNVHRDDRGPWDWLWRLLKRF
jgi:hypothetical protein